MMETMTLRLPPVKKYAAFLKKDFLIDSSYTLSFAMRWAGIVVSVCTFYYLSRLVGGRGAQHLERYGGDYFSFMIVGLAAMSYFNSCINGFAGTVAREQWAGTLEVLLALPLRLGDIFCGFSLYNILMGVAAAGLHLFVGGYVLGVSLSGAGVISALIIFALATLCFLGLGMMAASCVIIFKRGDPVTWLVSNLFWLFGGAYFPVDVFPPAIRTISYGIPSTYALHALRLALLRGYTPRMLAGELSVLAVFSIIFFAVGVCVLYSAVRYAKRRGTIAFY